MNITTTLSQVRVPVTIFRITGDLNAETSEELVQRAQAAHQAGSQDLLLDLETVGFVSSAGLRAVHAIFMMLGTGDPDEDESSVRKGIVAGSYHSPHLKLLNPSREVLRTLEMGGFDTFLEIYTNEQRALASY